MDGGSRSGSSICMASAIFRSRYYLGEERGIVTQIPYPKTGPYPVTMSVPYPLAGTTNSAVRAGVVDVGGGPVKWLELPGDPRAHYIARLLWADADTVLLQQLNRLQNVDAYLLADARSGARARDVAGQGRGVHHHRVRRASRGAADPRRSGVSRRIREGRVDARVPRRPGRPGNARDPRRHRHIRHRRRRREGAAGCTSSPRPRMRRSAICTARPSTARRIPCA